MTSTTSWTIADLQMLEKAIAQGALRVKYADKEIEYRSLDDMLRLADLMRKDLGTVNPNAGRKYADFNKGLQ